MKQNQNHKNVFLTHFSFFLFLLLVFLLLISYFFVVSENSQTIDPKWQETKTDEVVLLTSDTFTLTEDSILSLTPNFNKIRIKSNAEVIFEYGFEDSIFNNETKLIGNPLLTVLLQKGTSQQLQIEFSGNSLPSLANNVRIYPYQSFYYQPFRQILPSLCICIVFLLIGFFCLFLFFYYKRRKSILDGKELLFFSVFSFLCGIWLLTDNPFFNFFIPNTEWTIFISFTCFLLLPLFFLLFMGEQLKQKTTGYYLLLFTTCAHVIFSIFCHIAGIYSFYLTNIITHLLGIIIIIYFIIKNYQIFKRYHEKNGRIIVRGLLLALVFILIALSMFYIQDSSFYSLVYIFGILFLYICLIHVSIQKNYELFLELKNVEFLKNQAYQDNLTSTYNRSAYIIDVNQLSGDFTLFLVDINSLKNINDTKGHKAGDILITRCSDVLKNVFVKDGGKIYRFGGDEFVVIIPTKDYQKYLDNLQNNLKRVNDKEDIILTFSIGYCASHLDRPSYEKVEKAFEVADVMMYEEKRKYYKQMDRRKK